MYYSDMFSLCCASCSDPTLSLALDDEDFCINDYWKRSYIALQFLAKMFCLWCCTLCQRVANNTNKLDNAVTIALNHLHSMPIFEDSFVAMLFVNTCNYIEQSAAHADECAEFVEYLTRRSVKTTIKMLQTKYSLFAQFSSHSVPFANVCFVFFQ